jgi:NAD(P)-dependent dehydrogenase (short-subunit alcohol dehydrogenase family)
MDPKSSQINFGLAGRVCIVTGGAQGIGEACIRRFAREGAQVVVADIDDARGTALAAELGGLYGHCDVGDKAQVDALVAQTMAAHGRIDVLVNNAGIFRAADFLDMSEADFDAVLRVNLKGSFLMGQAVAREMAKAGGGSIVNMSSVNGVLAIPTIASYNVSKGGINQLTRVMALSLADKGIRVNAVAPGTIATELASKAVLTSEGPHHEPHAHAATGRAAGSCRHGGLPGQRRRQLHHRRDRRGRRRAHDAELHRGALTPGGRARATCGEN